MLGANMHVAGWAGVAGCPCIDSSTVRRAAGMGWGSAGIYSEAAGEAPHPRRHNIPQLCNAGGSTGAMWVTLTFLAIAQGKH